MGKTYNTGYQRPEVLMLELESEDVFCVSGNHEGITIEDWYWAESFFGDSFH